MSNNTLYELSVAFNQVEEILTNPDFNFGVEEMQNLQDAYAQIEGDLHEKLENTVKIIKNFEAEADMIDAEIKRLQARKKTVQAKADWSRNNVKTTMDYHGIKKVKSVLFSISLSDLKDGSLLVETDLDNIPEQYIVVKKEVNKTLLKTDIKHGLIEIDGVTIEKIKTLTIR